MTKQLHFIGRPDNHGRHDLVQRVADFLLGIAPDHQVPDLSRTLLVLPGQNAIRLLTDRLAATGRGIFPPDTATSGGLIHFGIDVATLAPAEQNLLWQQILNEPETDRCNALFLYGLDRSNRKLIAGLAENLTALQVELNRELLSFADAANILQGTADHERWKDLAGLELRFNALLEKYGLPDPLRQRQDAVSDLTVFRNCERIVIAGVPDLPGPARKRLELLEQTHAVRIDILVDAPPEMAIRFDSWGGVIPKAWSEYPLKFEPDGQNRIHVAADPADLAALARELLPENGIFDCRKTVIATADPALAPWIRRELENVPGMPEIYDPAGLPAGKLDLAPLLRLFCRLTEEPQINVIRGLFSHRSFVKWLAKTCSATENDLLAALDAYRLEHPVDVLDTQSPYARSEGLRRAFNEILQIRALLRSSTGPEKTLRELFSRIYCNMPQPLHGVSFRQEAEKFSNLLEQFTKSPLLAKLPAQDFYDALANAAEKLRFYPEHAPDAVEITGFLDLPFRNAERIILCGVNEGVLPESIQPSNFLNDTKRKILGLPDNALRFARDCFYLYTILKDAPRSEFLVSRTDDKGAPLRASTLFFAGSKNLEQRAGILFSPPPVRPENTAGKSSLSFGIEPDLTHAFCSKDDPEQIQLSVTTFKDLLNEKTLLDTFFSRSMGMAKNDYEATELDQLAFGTVFHAALEHFDVRSCSSEEEAVNTLCANFDRELTKKCGAVLPLAIRVQKEMFLRRVDHTARKLYAEKDSFDLLKQEWNLNGGKGILFHDILIKGKIDRIEISRDRKILRLIDFKTSDKGDSPETIHCGKKCSGDEIKFVDLQLPLYRMLLPLDETFWQEVGLDREDVRFECGYFNIPKAVTGIGYSMWRELELLLEKAEQTVEEVATRIRTEIRRSSLAKFKPKAYSEFLEFYRPDPRTAIRGIKWEAENEEEAEE